MAWTPLENLPRQWLDTSDNTVLNGYWLIAFEAGTATRSNMAIDESGSGSAAKFQTNSNGYLVTSGGTVIRPFVSEEVKLALVPTEAEADASDTTNAVWPTIDNVKGIGFGFDSTPVDNVAALKALDATVFTTARTLGYGSTKGDGAASYYFVSGDTTTPNAYVFADDAATGRWFMIPYGGEYTLLQGGMVGDDSTNNDTAWNNIYSGIGVNGVLRGDPGTFVMTSTMLLDRTNNRDYFRFIGAGRNQTIFKTSSAITLMQIERLRFYMEGFQLLKAGATAGIGLLVTSEVAGSQTGPGEIKDYTLDGFDKGVQFGEATAEAASEICMRLGEIRNNNYGIYSPVTTVGQEFTTNIIFEDTYWASNTKNLEWNVRGGLRIYRGSTSNCSTSFHYKIPRGAIEPCHLDNVFSENSDTYFVRCGPDTAGTGHGLSCLLQISNCNESESQTTDSHIQLHCGGLYHIGPNTKLSGRVGIAAKVDSGDEEQCNVLIESCSLKSAIAWNDESPESTRLVVKNVARTGTSTLVADEVVMWDENSVRYQHEGFGGKITPASPKGFTVDGAEPSAVFSTFNVPRWLHRVIIDDARLDIIDGAVTGVTIVTTAEVRGGIITVVRVAKEAFTDASTTESVRIFTLPAGTFVMGVWGNTNEAYAGTGLTGTLDLECGTSVDADAFLVAYDCKSGVVFRGDGDADLGTAINRANAVQGGWISSISSTTDVELTLTHGTSGNLGNGSTTNLTAGTTDIHILHSSIGIGLT